MKGSIPVHLAVEDELSEAVLRRLLQYANRGYAVGTVYGRGGYGYLRKTISGWNNAARGTPFVILADLDRYDCAPALIGDWIPGKRHPNLLLRVAVREVESWVLADAAHVAGFLGVRQGRIPRNPDLLSDPKAALVGLAAISRSRDLRSRLVPKRGSTAKQGRDYNACLIEFIRDAWSVAGAMDASPSLARTVRRLLAFEPAWQLR